MIRDDLANPILERSPAIAHLVTEKYFSLHPERARQWGAAGIKRCTEDTVYHLSYLAEAIRFAFPTLFHDYIGWAKVLLNALHIPPSDLQQNLSLIRSAIAAELPGEVTEKAGGILDSAVELLPAMPTELESFIHPGDYFDLTQGWLKLLLARETRAARELIWKAIDSGTSLMDIYEQVFTPALYEVGRLWQHRQINEAQEHFCAGTTETTLALLSSRIDVPRTGHSIVGLCVANEQHSIGIRLVLDCFALNGWNHASLGGNVPTRNLKQIVFNWEPDVVAISATMTFNLGELARAIQEIRAAEVKTIPKVIVGGRPFIICPDLGSEIGADYTSVRCGEAVALFGETEPVGA